jgi:2-polyprenyl-6-methoxyphenol hydroxylase-like FAD-dependent oxidoreductase
MSESPKVVIIGGSLGGLFAANLLVRAGWDVHIYERVAEELEGRGAGIVTHPELMEALSAADIPTDRDIGVKVQERVTLAHDGSVLGRRTMPQILTAWGHLYHILKKAFPEHRYHNGYTLEFIEQSEDSVHLIFNDDHRDRAELVVAADGLRSTIRQALLPATKPTYAGYVAWRGLVEESALSDRVKEEIFPYFAFGIPPHEQMIAYPVAGQENGMAPGKRRFNFVWYRPAEETTTFKDMVTDAKGCVWVDGIPPPLIRPDIRAQPYEAAQSVLAPQFVEVVKKSDNLFFQPIFDLESPRMAMGHVALLGDAAFVARPHCGMGVTKAAGDAMALVKSLQDYASTSIQEALSEYEQQRLKFGSSIVEHSRNLGAYMQAQLHTAEEQEMAERYRTPAAIMRETAVANISDIGL